MSAVGTFRFKQRNIFSLTITKFHGEGELFYNRFVLWDLTSSARGQNRNKTACYAGSRGYLTFYDPTAHSASLPVDSTIVVLLKIRVKFFENPKRK